MENKVVKIRWMQVPGEKVTRRKKPNANEWTDHDTWEVISGLLVLALMIAPFVLLFWFWLTHATPESVRLPWQPRIDWAKYK